MVAFPSLAVCNEDAITALGSGTYYLPITGFMRANAMDVDHFTIRVPKAGRFINPRIVVLANAALGDHTLSLFINGVSVSGASVIIPAGVADVFTPAWDVPVAAGDIVCYRLVRSGNSGALKLASAQIDYEADDGTATGWVVTSASDAVVGSAGTGWASAAAVFSSIWSFASSYALLLSQGQVIPWGTDATITGLRIPWLTRTAPGPNAISVAINGSVALTAVLPAGAPQVVRVTGSVDLAPDDTICLYTDFTGIGFDNPRFGMIQIDVVWDADEYELVGMVSPYSTGSYCEPGFDTFRPVASQLRLNPVADPAGVQLAVPEGARAHNLRTSMFLSVRDADWPSIVQRNGADTALQIINPSDVSGVVIASNDVDEVILSAGDLVAFCDRVPAGGGTNANANGMRLTSLTFTMGSTPSQEVETTPGELIVSGGQPSLTVDEVVNALAGSLLLTPIAPVIVTNVEIDVPRGAAVLQGRRPTVRQGVSISASPGRLQITGGQPVIFTDFRAVLPQQAALAVVEPPPPPMRLSQQATLAAGYVIPPVAVSQQAVLILVDGSPCVTERCQLWRIKRRDGVEFRYTSLDRDVRYGGQVYKSCGSLNPSASEDASTLGTVSNIELEGIISDDGITEADLYGGLFDDAYVTVDLVAWGALPESPRRLASGWTGELSQGDTGFKMEVLGAGSRLDQQALVQMVTPGCRWVFGDSRCGKDLEAMKLTGEVTGSVTRSVFGASLSGDGAGRQWENGTVRFTSGVNEGQRLEVRSVDFAAGVVNLWPSAAFRAEPGDTFDLLPGCDKSRDGGCTLYANVINHGGFPDVPGNDAILETPDAQY